MTAYNPGETDKPGIWLRIAFFNWRDIKNPLAGGAEVYNHELLKRLVGKGHKITVFTSSFSGAPQTELIDGIEHIRYAGKFMIYSKSYSCYKKHIEGKYDVIIEGINGVPFFMKLFAKEKVVPLIYQLTRENWYSGIAFPAAFVGYHAEDSMLSLYKKNPAIAISESGKKDLEKLGFKNVEIIYASHDVIPPPKIEKEKEKTIIYLGRLAKSKRVNHVLEAFAMIKSRIKNTKLWIVGGGPEEKNLKELAERLGIKESTEFFGKVSQEKKADLLSKAHLMLFPAVKEGWGITVLEANACGTPVIGYDVSGLKDSIKTDINGYLVEEGDVNRMAKCSAELLENENVLEKMSSDARHYSKKFNWDESAERLTKFLEKVIE